MDTGMSKGGLDRFKVSDYQVRELYVTITD